MKLKLLTVLFLIVYILSFTSHLNDFIEGFKEGNCAYRDGQEYTTIVIKKELTTERSKILLERESNQHITAQITDTEETLKIEVPKTHSSIISLLLGLMGLFTLLLIPMLLIVIFKFFKNLYKGNIVEKDQIGRLQFLAFIQIAYAILGNLLVYFTLIEEQKIADLYNQTLVKSTEYDITLFFIPLILLMIIEVLKQHLRLKEDAELTI